MSQMLSTVRCRAALASRKDAVDSDILLSVRPPMMPAAPAVAADAALPLMLPASAVPDDDDDVVGCLFVEARGGCCCCWKRLDAGPPSMARKMNEPVQIWTVESEKDEERWMGDSVDNLLSGVFLRVVCVFGCWVFIITFAGKDTRREKERWLFHLVQT